MATFSVLGDDTIKLGDIILENLGHGEVAKVTYSTELATVKTGKNGNTIFVQNASGFQATMEFKVIRGSSNDKDLQTLVTSYKTNPSTFVLQNAEIAKNIGDGIGGKITDVYILTGGIPSKQVEVVVNVEGDVEQALSVYTFVFATSDRQLSL
jgi:hypothetical protein